MQSDMCTTVPISSTYPVLTVYAEEEKTIYRAATKTIPRGHLVHTSGRYDATAFLGLLVYFIHHHVETQLP